MRNPKRETRNTRAGTSNHDDKHRGMTMNNDLFELADTSDKIDLLNDDLTRETPIDDINRAIAVLREILDNDLAPDETRIKAARTIVEAVKVRALIDTAATTEKGG